MPARSASRCRSRVALRLQHARSRLRVAVMPSRQRALASREAAALHGRRQMAARRRVRQRAGSARPSRRQALRAPPAAAATCRPAARRAAPRAATRAAASASSPRARVRRCRRAQMLARPSVSSTTTGVCPRRRTASASVARRVDAGGERRAAAAGQAGEAALGAHQRARRRQQQLGAAAAKREQRDAVAPHVAVGQQQFDRALRFGQPMQRRRARGVDDEDRRGPRALPEARDAKVVARARRCARGAARSRRRRARPRAVRCHGAAARSVSITFSRAPARGVAAPHAGRPAAQRRLPAHAGASRRIAHATAPAVRAGCKLRQQVRRECAACAASRTTSSSGRSLHASVAVRRRVVGSRLRFVAVARPARLGGRL